MITDTNALLSIGFSIIANFTNVVEVPAVGVPTRNEELADYVVGTPGSPTDLYMVHRRGSGFWIRGGIVYRFDCPGAFCTLQDPEALPRFLGEPMISSNQAVQLAVDKVTRLLRNGNPLTNAVISVKNAGVFQGKTIPFYEVKWSALGERGKELARVEVDARKAQIVFMHLWDEAFYDRTQEDEIRKRVLRPAGPLQAQMVPQRAPWEGPPPVTSPPPPVPTTNQVLPALENWLWFCEKSGVRSGSQTNLSDVDWTKSHVTCESILGKRKPVCVVHFKNGASFVSYNGAVFRAWAPGHREGLQVGIIATSHPEELRGTIGADWLEVVGRMERTLTREFGISEKMLRELVRMPMNGPPKPGSIAWYPLSIWWCPKPRGHFRLEDICPHDLTAAVYAVFDLRDGSVECLDFGGDAKMVQAVIRTQQQRKR